ncbi:hypothetical protein HDV00_006444 [Rhizophlyctis rosea]|nr:hypothetical protein HDV00_006444 [Rhizophlyctis rosea]
MFDPALPTILITILAALTTATAQTLQFTSSSRYPVQFHGNLIANHCGVRIDYDTITHLNTPHEQTPIYPNTAHYGPPGRFSTNGMVEGLLFGVGSGHICYARSTTPHVAIQPGYECTISNCHRSGYLGGMCSLTLHCTPPAHAQRPAAPAPQAQRPAPAPQPQLQRPAMYRNPRPQRDQNSLPTIFEEAALDSPDDYDSPDDVEPVVAIIPL